MNSAIPVDGIHRRVRVPKSAELIADQLRSQIVRGVLKAGDTLPPELVLGKQFGVSRPTLREAFRILETESLILVRRGSRGGVQVVSPDISVAARDVGLLLQMSGTTLADVYEARTALEPSAVRILASKRSKKDVDDLTACVDQLSELVESGVEGANLDGWSEAAYRFHDLIIERADNQTLAILAGVLREVVAGHLSTAVTRTSDRAELVSQFRKTIRAFRKLITLVDEKKTDEAEKYWRMHMQTAGKKVLWGSLATESVVDLFN